MTSRRSRDWCFTINNPTDGDDPQLWLEYRYVFWSRERGLGGTVHLQGFVIWTTDRTLNWVRSRSARAHWEIMKGTVDQNEKYCSKSPAVGDGPGRLDGPWVRGTRPQPGKRNDIHACTDMIDRGKSLGKIARAYPVPYIKYHGGLKSYRLETSPDRHGQPNIIIVWGPSGCGKSRLVYEVFPEAYRKPNCRWWDGYHTQAVVVVEEFYSWIAYDEMLRLLDWYPMVVEIKNGMVRMMATTFVFTSNEDPAKWYSNERFFPTALHRRFKDFGLVLKYDIGQGDFVIDNQFKR